MTLIETYVLPKEQGNTGLPVSDSIYTSFDKRRHLFFHLLHCYLLASEFYFSLPVLALLEPRIFFVPFLVSIIVPICARSRVAPLYLKMVVVGLVHTCPHR